MLTVLAVIAGIVAAIVAIILLIAAFKANDFRIQRSIEIHAAPGTIFSLINDLHENSRWSPFEKDPAMSQRTQLPKKKLSV